MKREINMEPDARLTMSERLAFSIGGQGGNFYVMIISSFLLVYYTNVVGLNAGVVATLMGVSKFFDGLSDIVAGRILDHTNTRHGKFRPWLLRMIPFTMVSMFLMFNVPANASDVAKMIYVFVTYNLANTVCLTIISVAGASLNGAMTMNQAERGLCGGSTMIFGIVGGIILNSTVLQISAAVSGGDIYSRTGWRVMILIYSVVYALLTLIQYFGTRERVTLANMGHQENVKQERKADKNDQVGILEALKILIRDKYWVIFVISMICVVFLQTSLGMSNIYYSQYVLEDVLLYTPLSNFQSIASLIGALVTLPLLTKLKKRDICITACVMLTIGAVLPAIHNSMPILYTSAVFRGLGVGTAACVLPGMLQDSITYAQWQSDKDVLGMGNAAYSFTNKIGGSVGTILLGWMLNAGGFDGTLAVQPGGAIAAIKALYIWVPFVMGVLCVVCMAFYDLDSKYAKIAEELKERMKARNKADVEK